MGVDAMVLGIGGGAGGSERLLLVLENEQLRTFSKSCIAFWPGGCSSILRKVKRTSYVTEDPGLFFRSYVSRACRTQMPGAMPAIPVPGHELAERPQLPVVFCPSHVSFLREFGATLNSRWRILDGRCLSHHLCV